MLLRKNVKRFFPHSSAIEIFTEDDLEKMLQEQPISSYVLINRRRYKRISEKDIFLKLKEINIKIKEVRIEGQNIFEEVFIYILGVDSKTIWTLKKYFIEIK